MYQKDILAKAFELKEQESRNRQSNYISRLNKAKIKFPRLNEIDFELSKIGTSLMNFALSGDTKKIEESKILSQRLKEEKEEILEKANIEPFTPVCSVCNDTGRVKGNICECVKKIAKEISIAEFNKSTPMDKSGFNDFSLDYYPEEARRKMENIFNFSLNYAKNFSLSSENILFIGKCGLGKTHLSLSIAKEITKKGFGVIYGSAQNLFAQAEKEHFSYSSQSEKRDSLLNCDLLILDDLGAEFTTNFTQSLFYNIVNTRLLNRRPTVINTNLDFDELTDRYTARITSRFLGEYTVKQFLGNDIRQIKAMEKLKK